MDENSECRMKHNHSQTSLQSHVFNIIRLEFTVYFHFSVFLITQTFLRPRLQSNLSDPFQTHSKGPFYEFSNHLPATTPFLTAVEELPLPVCLCHSLMTFLINIVCFFLEAVNVFFDDILAKTTLLSSKKLFIFKNCMQIVHYIEVTLSLLIK